MDAEIDGGVSDGGISDADISDAELFDAGGSDSGADASLIDGGPLDCQRLCLADRVSAQSLGCDCESTCHNACTWAETDCGLPCNSDVPGYACPYEESEVRSSNDCTLFEGDTGEFEHRGLCYRCGDGQQCCYDVEGHDNGTGSYDLCPPLDPGPNDPDPNGCSGTLAHCACDVVTLCGCMAESGDISLCERCVGTRPGDLLSCNAPGVDATFCQRAADASAEGFSWCERVGDIDHCFDRPPGF